MSLLISVFALAAAAGGTLCRPAETPIFSCSTGTKIVSVCTTERLIAYRFGTSRAVAPEMQIVSDGKDGKVHSDVITGGGGGQQTSLRFTNRDTNYIVFSGYAGQYTDIPGKEWAGVDVFTRTKEGPTLMCRGGKRIDLNSSTIPDFVPADPENGPFSGWR